MRAFLFGILGWLTCSTICAIVMWLGVKSEHPFWVNKVEDEQPPDPPA